MKDGDMGTIGLAWIGVMHIRMDPSLAIRLKWTHQCLHLS